MPDEVPADVGWIAVGDPEAGNLGIVAATVVPDDEAEDALSLFVTVANDRDQQRLADWASTLVEQTNLRRGVAAVLGAEDRFAVELAANFNNGFSIDI